jgi:hypothetical protein
MIATLEDRAIKLTARPVKAGVYLRQPLDRTGEGLAVSRHLEDCLRLCAEKGWDVAEVYEDNDTSATKGVRKHYQRMLSPPTGRCRLLTGPAQVDVGPTRQSGRWLAASGQVPDMAAEMALRMSGVPVLTPSELSLGSSQSETHGSIYCPLGACKSM